MPNSFANETPFPSRGFLVLSVKMRFPPTQDGPWKLLADNWWRSEIHLLAQYQAEYHESPFTTCSHPDCKAALWLHSRHGRGVTRLVGGHKTPQRRWEFRSDLSWNLFPDSHLPQHWPRQMFTDHTHYSPLMEVRFLEEEVGTEWQQLRVMVSS